MKDVLLDTDIIIEILRGNAQIRAQFKKLILDGVGVAYTPVSLAEVHAGMRAGEEGTIEQFFRALSPCPLDDAAGQMAGRYLRTYSRSHRIELGDALLAGAACSGGYTLWTRNKKHYPMQDVELFGGTSQ